MLQISRILHAGYLFEYGSTRVLFDPIFENPFSVNCYAFPEVEFDTRALAQEKFDAIFISHVHDDHFSLESLNLLNRKIPIYLFSHFPKFFEWLKKLGFENVKPIQIDTTIKVGELNVTARRALDAEIDLLFHIDVNGLNVLNVVDSWIDQETFLTLTKTKWDLILWPFQTMRELEVLNPAKAAPANGQLPQEWLDQLAQLRPRFLIPSSCQFQMEPWSWYNSSFFPISYAGFAKQVMSVLRETQIFRLEPGQQLQLTKEGIATGSGLKWVQVKTAGEVDYHYSPRTIPMPTAEIAKKLPSLETSKLQTVQDFCEIDLPRRIAELHADDNFDHYFSKERHWHLQIYDGQGKATDFFYKIHGAVVVRISSSINSVAWKTEIPAVKLFNALFRGESLTSLYVRINCEIDVMEDPLIRVLFEGRVGTYQSCQLAEILARTLI